MPECTASGIGHLQDQRQSKAQRQTNGCCGDDAAPRAGAGSSFPGQPPPGPSTNSRGRACAVPPGRPQADDGASSLGRPAAAFRKVAPMTAPLTPGDVLHLNEPDYLYGTGVLRLRVTKVGTVQRLGGNDWLDVEGLTFRADGTELSSQ